MVAEAPRPEDAPERPAALPARRRSGLARAGVALTILLVAGIVGMGLLASFMGAQPAIDVMQRGLRSIRPWVFLVDLTVIGLVWWKFAPVVRFAARMRLINPAGVQGAIAARHRLMGLVMLFYVVVVMGFPLRMPWLG